jgi:hypothetical protein
MALAAVRERRTYAVVLQAETGVDSLSSVLQCHTQGPLAHGGASQLL